MARSASQTTSTHEENPRGAVKFPETDPEAKRKIVNRLRRAHGQLAAVIGAVESEAHCRDIVQQLSAVSKALDRAGFLVISTALRECLADPNDETRANPEELEKLFLSLA